MPLFSRRHYEWLAQRCREAIAYNKQYSPSFDGEVDGQHILHNTIRHFSECLASDNPDFNCEKFMIAVYRKTSA